MPRKRQPQEGEKDASGKRGEGGQGADRKEPPLRAAPTRGLWTHSLGEAAGAAPGDSRLITLPKVTQVISGKGGLKLRSDSRPACRENRLENKCTEEATCEKQQKGRGVDRAERRKEGQRTDRKGAWSPWPCLVWGWAGGEQQAGPCLQTALGLKSWVGGV